MAKLNLKKIQPLIDEKYIAVQKHPTADLYIYNYTHKCQFDKAWNEYTLMCRGLITDKDGNIKARPFPKFFNLEEVESVPNEPFDVYEKMDGSLGILYWIENSPYPWIATRGSFVSDQAQRANKILMNKYAHWCDKLDKTKTYLFEIIYPENRIVVDYKDKEELVLLAVIDTETGEEIDFHEYSVFTTRVGFPFVEKYSGFDSPDKVKSHVRGNAEGYVLRFKPSNYRVKVKFDEYKRLHKILTGISAKDIWECMLNHNFSIDPIIENVPDEFYSWAKDVQKDLSEQYALITGQTVAKLTEILQLQGPHLDRKEFAQHAKSFEYPHLLFLSLDSKDLKEAIFKIIKPKHAKVFKIETEL